jgi:diguanylate cyclase (GGDEF)-like protein
MRISDLIHQAVQGLNTDASDGRWGGEEFMLMLPGAAQASAAAFAEELRQEIEKLRFEKCGKVTASFGVAQALPGEDPDPLVVRADTALYKAKASGKNTVCVATEKDEQ